MSILVEGGDAIARRQSNLKGAAPMNYPPIYETIMTSGKPDPMVRYKATFEGAQPTDVATIEQAQTFLRKEMNDVCIKYRNTPLANVSIVAVEAGPSGAGRTGLFIPVEQMLRDGFPPNHPCRLSYVIRRGEAVQKDEDEQFDPRTSQYTGVFEVRDLIFMRFSQTNGESDMWDHIKSAVR